MRHLPLHQNMTKIIQIYAGGNVNRLGTTLTSSGMARYWFHFGRGSKQKFKTFWKLNYHWTHYNIYCKGGYRKKESPAITDSPTCGEENDNPVLAQTSTSHPSTMARGTKESLCNGEDNCKTSCENGLVFGFVGPRQLPLWMARQIHW